MTHGGSFGQAARRGDELVINCLRSLAMDAVQQVWGLQRSAVGGRVTSHVGGHEMGVLFFFWGGVSNLMLKFVR